MPEFKDTPSGGMEVMQNGVWTTVPFEAAAEIRRLRYMPEWLPIEDAPKGRSVDDRMQTVLIVGRYPMNGERTDIIESWWDHIDGKWMRWKHQFAPSHFMVPPDVPKNT